MFVERERKLALERINRGSKADVGRVLQKSELVFEYAHVYDRLNGSAEHILAAFTDWRVSDPITVSLPWLSLIRHTGVCRRHHLFRSQFCFCVHLGLLANDHYDFWLQYASQFSIRGPADDTCFASQRPCSTPHHPTLCGFNRCPSGILLRFR